MQVTFILSFIFGFLNCFIQMQVVDYDTFRRVRLQQIFYRSIVENDNDMTVRCLHHGADVNEEYLPVC